MNNDKWFTNCKTLDELKTEYRRLVMEWHPDLKKHEKAECHANIVSINNSYEKVFIYLQDHSTDDQRKKDVYKKHDLNDGYREVIEKIIFLPNIVIEICGSWIWVTGETKKVKEELKKAKFIYSKKKTDLSAWWWHPVDFIKMPGNGHTPLDKIRFRYGSDKIETTERSAVN